MLKKKMREAAKALRFDCSEKNYIEHINQSCPRSVLWLINRYRIVERELLKLSGQKTVGAVTAAHDFEDAACYND